MMFRKQRVRGLILLALWCVCLSVNAATESTPLEIRGTLPWHNFLSGPSAWNEEDYRAYLDELAALKLNFVGFHCYTGGAERYAPYVEPLIRNEYRNIVPETTLDTSLTARWGYRPLAVRDFLFGTDKAFKLPRGVEAFGADCAVTARSRETHYEQAQTLMRRVIKFAHERGMQVAMGFEFGVHPPEFASIVPPNSRIPGAMLPDPTHAANIEILRNTLDNILTAYPGVDWIWLWLHEHSMFIAKPQLSGKFGEAYAREKAWFSDARNEQDVFTGVWSLIHIRQAQEYLSRKSPTTRLVIGGWGGGEQLPAVLRGLDRALPSNIVFSCLNPGMGEQGHVPALTDIATRRQVWSMPWLEGDAWLWHLQLRAASVMDQVKQARRANLRGAVGIHWRTAEIRPNLQAFALAANNPLQIPSGDSFYADYARAEFGESATNLGSLLLQWERERKLGYLASPEYYPYEPSWGRMSPGLRQQLSEAVKTLQRMADGAQSRTHLGNLRWLADNLTFALLLDEVGRAIEPAYQFRERFFRGELDASKLPAEALAARTAFGKAPVEELFRTYARRVRSRGELGVLSSLNQKLGLQYLELEKFLRTL